VSTHDWLSDALSEFFAQAHRVSSLDIDDARDKRLEVTYKILTLISEHTVPETLLRRLTQPIVEVGDESMTIVIKDSEGLRVLVGGNTVKRIEDVFPTGAVAIKEMGAGALVVMHEEDA